MTKPIKWVWAQRRLRSAWASAQSDQSSLCDQWVAKDPRILHADSEHWSDWAEAQDDLSLRWGTLILLVLSCRGSFSMVYCYLWCVDMKSVIADHVSQSIVNFLNIRIPKIFFCNHSKIWPMWLYHRVMSPNDADGMANSVDPDQTAPRSSLIWVCSVCPAISVRKRRTITVYEENNRRKNAVFLMSLRIFQTQNFILVKTRCKLQYFPVSVVNQMIVHSCSANVMNISKCTLDLFKTIEPSHEKTCLMSYANNICCFTLLFAT